VPLAIPKTAKYKGKLKKRGGSQASPVHGIAGILRGTEWREVKTASYQATGGRVHAKAVPQNCLVHAPKPEGARKLSLG